MTIEATGISSEGRVGISPEVASAVEGTVLNLLRESSLLRPSATGMQQIELAERIVERTLHTYNSVKGHLPEPALAIGVTGCVLEAAIRYSLEMLINRLTYMQDVDDGWKLDQENEFLGQIMARLKQRDYPIDPRGYVVLYDNNGQVVAQADVSVGYAFGTMPPSAFEEGVKALIERFQGRSCY
jgi:hypothetical protein